MEKAIRLKGLKNLGLKSGSRRKARELASEKQVQETSDNVESFLRVKMIISSVANEKGDSERFVEVPLLSSDSSDENIENREVKNEDDVKLIRAKKDVVATHPTIHDPCGTQKKGTKRYVKCKNRKKQRIRMKMVGGWRIPVTRR